MYRCSLCEDVTPPRQNRLTYVVKRKVPAKGNAPERTETESEIPVCERCKRALAPLEKEVVRGELA